MNQQKKQKQKTNTIATKKTTVTSTASINCYGKKVTDCPILDTVLLVIILLLIIPIICKIKRCNIKWKTMNFKKFVSKIVVVIISLT